MNITFNHNPSKDRFQKVTSSLSTCILKWFGGHSSALDGLWLIIIRPMGDVRPPNISKMKVHKGTATFWKRALDGLWLRLLQNNNIFEEVYASQTKILENGTWGRVSLFDELCEDVSTQFGLWTLARYREKTFPTGGSIFQNLRLVGIKLDMSIINQEKNITLLFKKYVHLLKSVSILANKQQGK